MQNKLDGIKALLAWVAANAQLAVLYCWFLLNAAFCRCSIETMGYTAWCADSAFGSQMPLNAAKCCKNAGKFFPDVAPPIFKARWIRNYIPFKNAK